MKSSLIYIALAFFCFPFITNAQQKPTIEWIEIPGGTFNMGSPENESQRVWGENLHQVTISPFKMSKYEITFKQYDQFCQATGRAKPDDGGFGRGNRPVINVNWDDANAFAVWMGCRLPTDAEWEYACRATTTTAFNTGDCLNSDANYDGYSPLTEDCLTGKRGKKTMPVGSYKPNIFGLFDMHGNVSEWCSDWMSDDLLVNSVDPKGPEKGYWKVIRGGSWNEGAGRCRSASRNGNVPSLRNLDLGFRLVSSVSNKN